jgi:hypothetical protein
MAMHRMHWAVITAAALATACGVARSSDEEQKRALEHRVTELEEKLAAAEQAPGAAEPSAATPARVPEPPANPVPSAPPRRQKVAIPHPPAPVPEAEAREREPMPPPDAEAAPREAPRSVDAAAVEAPSPPQMMIPKDTTLHLVIEDALSSERSHAGDRVVARVERAVGDSGEVVLPGGTYLEGRVVTAQPAGRVKGRAHLEVAFDGIVVRGSRYRLETTGLSLEGEASHGRDAAMVAGGAVAGAILGKITGGSAGKGAVLGGAAGGGAVLATKGKEIDLPAGSRYTVKVTKSREIEG